jgi:hypothetical protein
VSSTHLNIVNRLLESAKMHSIYALENDLCTLEKTPGTRYAVLKRQLRQIHASVEQSGNRSTLSIQRIADSVINNRIKGTGSLSPMSDVDFCTSLDPLFLNVPIIRPLVKELQSSMLEILKNNIKELQKVVDDIERKLQSQVDKNMQIRFFKRKQTEEETAWKNLRQDLATRLGSNLDVNRYDLVFSSTHPFHFFSERPKFTTLHMTPDLPLLGAVRHFVNSLPVFLIRRYSTSL